MPAISTYRDQEGLCLQPPPTRIQEGQQLQPPSARVQEGHCLQPSPSRVQEGQRIQPTPARIQKSQRLLQPSRIKKGHSLQPSPCPIQEGHCMNLYLHGYGRASAFHSTFLDPGRPVHSASTSPVPRRQVPATFIFPDPGRTDACIRYHT
jgi:hypothetical protein